MHEEAIDAVIDVKRNEARGQDSLFGAFDEPGEDPGGAFSVAIPDGEWDKSTLLTFEREMLGLYVSSHPLDGAERVLDANRDTTIAELLASGRTEGFVQVSGIISGLQRKVTKQGNQWAIVNLEDHDAGVECLIFPKSYVLYSEALAEDRVVSIRGRVNVRDETLSVYGEEVTVLDVSQITDGELPVVISVPETRVNPRLVQELKRILDSHPGRAPVHLRLQSQRPGKGLLLNLERFQVNPQPAFYGDIKSLLGAHSVGA